MTASKHTSSNSDVQTLVKVPFHGSEIECVQDGGSKVWVGIAKTCEVLGIDGNGQTQRLKRAEWAQTCIIHVSGNDGLVVRQFMVDMDTFPMWLATIDANRVNSEARPMLVRYQREARDVLARHFAYGQRGVALDARVLSALEMLGNAINQLAANQQSILARMDALEARANGSPGCVGPKVAADIKARLLYCAKLQNPTKWRSARNKLDGDLRDEVGWFGLSSHMRTWEWLPLHKRAQAEHWLAGRVAKAEAEAKDAVRSSQISMFDRNNKPNVPITH